MAEIIAIFIPASNHDPPVAPIFTVQIVQIVRLHEEDIIHRPSGRNVHRCA